jgi:ribonuclease HI
MLNDYKSAALVDPRSSTARVTSFETWAKPETDFLKCNVDASFSSAPRFSGYGCVVRNDSGTFVSCMHGPLQGASSPYMAEALSVREALSWLKNNQVTNVIVESDCLNVISALNKSKSDSSHLGLVLNDCRTLAMGFNHCKFCFAKRSANSVAHCLAKAAYSATGLVEWSDHPPTCIVEDII